jgi:hypothetical protein
MRKSDKIISGIAGIDRQNLGAEAAAECGKAAAQREGEGEKLVRC